APASGHDIPAASRSPARGQQALERLQEEHRAVLVEEEERRRGGRPPLALAPRTQHRARLPLLLELKGGEPLSGEGQVGTAPAAGVEELEARRALGHDAHRGALAPTLVEEREARGVVRSHAERGALLAVLAVEDETGRAVG